MRALFFLLAISLPVYAQNNLPEQCKEFTTVPLPTEAAVAKPSGYPDCESYKSYSGIGRPIDYTAARACAWQERAAQQADLPQNSKAPIAWIVGGSVILSDLYANGFGTAKNLRLAMRFACEQSEFVHEAFDDLEARMTSKEAAAKPFDLCDYGASTFEMNFCEAYVMEKENAKRDRAIASLSRQWPPEQKAAFASAKKAFDNYVMSVGANETYQGGTIRDLRSMGAMEDMQKEFFGSFQRWEAGKIPHASAIDYKNRDVDLNRIYQEALNDARSAMASIKANNLPSNDEVQPEGIRKTERAWLAYRDAWAAFAILRYRSSTREAWLDELTESRIHRLLLLSCGENSSEKLCTPAIRKEIESLP